MNYDYIIIGAGIAGCSIAYHLHVRGKKVLLVDEKAIASNASKAAGAFLSPLGGKINSYNELVNMALEYSLDFYENLAPDLIVKKGLLKVAKNKNESLKLKESASDYLSINQLREISPDFKNIEGEYYPNAAIIEPVKMAEYMTKDIDTFFGRFIDEVVYQDENYHINGHSAKHLILASGVHKPLVKHPYIEIIPASGVRIEAKTSTNIPFNIHRKFSLSTQRKDGTIAIGATNTPGVCIEGIQKSAVESLINEVHEYIELKDFEVLESYIGARATIKSYFPVVGKLINAKESLKKHPSIMKGTKIPSSELDFYPNLYIFNAVGSRGFVFSPYLAKLLSEHLLDNKELPKEINPLKLFYKYARSEPTL